MPKPCAVESCPAFAAPPSKFCPGHKSAKRLLSVHKGRTCSKCGRALHAGDYVTVNSTPDKLTHAQCPGGAAATAKRSRASTPLFDAGEDRK